MKKAAGFTLIELLVVIGILSLLAVALLKNVAGATGTANEFTTRKDLEWWYSQITNYKGRYGQWPKGGGSEMLRTLWRSPIIENTPTNLQKFYSPFNIADPDCPFNTYKSIDLDDLWKESIDPGDTDYAARAKGQKRNWVSGKQAWMSDDNNDGTMWNTTWSMSMLFGDGSARTYHVDKEMVDLGWVTSDEAEAIISGDSDDVIEIGPQSRIPFLRKLDY